MVTSGHFFFCARLATVCCFMTPSGCCQLLWQLLTAFWSLLATFSPIFDHCLYFFDHVWQLLTLFAKSLRISSSQQSRVVGQESRFSRTLPTKSIPNLAADSAVTTSTRNGTGPETSSPRNCNSRGRFGGGGGRTWPLADAVGDRPGAILGDWLALNPSNFLWPTPPLCHGNGSRVSAGGGGQGAPAQSARIPSQAHLRPCQGGEANGRLCGHLSIPEPPVPPEKRQGGVAIW